MLSKDGGATWKVIEHDVTAALFLPDSDAAVLALVSEQQSALGIFNLGPKSTILKKIDISGSGISSSELPGLKKTQVSGVQFAGDYLHVVAVDSDVGV